MTVPGCHFENVMRRHFLELSLPRVVVAGAARASATQQQVVLLTCTADMYC